MLAWLHYHFSRFVSCVSGSSILQRRLRSGNMGRQPKVTQPIEILVKPVSDYFCFVTWSIILLEVTIRRNLVKMGRLQPMSLVEHEEALG